MNKPKRAGYKYDAAYIKYVENGESKAVYITRDIVETINTDGKWIDVLDIDRDWWDESHWRTNHFTVELFPRQTKPEYPKNASLEEKKYITWQTARTDIDKQRRQGYKGDKYRIYPKLVNMNKGKYITVRALWNKRFERWVPSKWMTPSCEWRKRRIELKPKWEYKIKAIQKL